MKMKRHIKINYHRYQFCYVQYSSCPIYVEISRSVSVVSNSTSKSDISRTVKVDFICQFLSHIDSPHQPLRNVDFSKIVDNKSTVWYLTWRLQLIFVSRNVFLKSITRHYGCAWTTILTFIASSFDGSFASWSVVFGNEWFLAENLMNDEWMSVSEWLN